MAVRYANGKWLGLFALFGVLALVQLGAGQDSTTPLLQLQRSRASLDIASNAKHAQGLEGLTYGNPGDVWNYPNSLSCLVVYGNGKFVLEKRDEQTVARPSEIRGGHAVGG
jgi:hypothetical protein